VLVIDDNPQIREVVHRVLSSAGYHVTTAASGQDGWPGESLQVIGKPFSRAALLTTVSRLLGTSVRGPDPE
jgi:response regulator RpfG family c-di-GMP phosphodiesterase